MSDGADVIAFSIIRCEVSLTKYRAKSFNGSLLACLISCYSLEFRSILAIQFKSSTSFSVNLINAYILKIIDS